HGAPRARLAPGARWRATPLGAALGLGACGGPSLDPIGEGPSSGAQTTDGGEVAWEHLGVVEGVLDEQRAAAVLTSDAEVEEAWGRLGFEGDAPTLRDDRVLLLLGRPDDACPDDLVELGVDDDRLTTGWQEPPGGCEQPLILWLHAVDVHRAVLAPGFTYGPDEPFVGELDEVTIEVEAASGDAPPAPEPDQAMSDEEVAAVFADHPVRPCGPEHDPIAAAFGDPDRAIDDDVLTEDNAAEGAAIEGVEAALTLLEGQGWEPDLQVTGLVDRSEGDARAAVVVYEADADEVQALLDRELGAGTVTVWADPWDPEQVRAAQRELTSLMDADGGPGAIVSASGAPGPVALGMIDPTREALDEVAAVADPALVCIEVLRSGQQPEPLS
ncbi:MAG: hypothetical protein JJT89_17250, partial [Nitriliruptoraceae bacterium]|nr:hypothetical protein [Nitriliruptoraceae bacterium]